MTKSTIYDVAILGGGPAGLTAGIYAARGAAKTIIFERQMPGGQITTTDHVENYPAFPNGISGAELGAHMAEQATKSGAEIAMFVEITAIERDEESGIFTLKSEYEDYQAKSLIIATGSVPRKLGIPGEAEYTGRGVSWCATCDANFYREKTVIVVGGGDAAIEEALYLTKFADKVIIVHRRDELRATAVIAERAKAHPKIEFALSRIPLEIVGDGSKVSGLRTDSTKGEGELLIEADGIFEFVGVDPVNEVAKMLSPLNERGYISVDHAGRTGVPGLYSAGDITDAPLKQVITAAGQGAAAAFEALSYLENLATETCALEAGIITE